MDRVKKLIHTDYAYKSGLSGKNVTVVVMDTGIVPHTDFEDRIIYFEDFCNGKMGLYDDNGHGTHVSGLKHEYVIRIHNARKKASKPYER